MYPSVCHVLTSPQIEKRKDEHPHKIDEVPVQAGDFDDLVIALTAFEKNPFFKIKVSPLNPLRASAIRKITPIVTWVPWKPVIRKKHDPNCGAPQGLPQGRTPSMISLVHSKACMLTNVAPNAAVASINAAVLTRS